MSDRSAATTSSIFIEYAGKTISTYHIMTPTTRKSIIIGVLLCASAVPTAIAADGFCTFYSEDRCEKRVGSVNYNTHNNGIFQNSGPYFKCAVDEEFSLISYPPGDSNGDRPNHCAVFPEGAFNSNCQHLDDLGFTTGDGGYYRISTDKTCPSLSKRDTNETTAATSERRSPARRRRFGRNVDMEKRNANYLGFFDDPGCEEKVGSKQYSTHNDGCFENSGAYALFGGDDQDWHIEEYAGTDGEQCTGQMTHCVDGSKFAFNENEEGGCMHLDSIGLMSGFGSYKIGRAGCP